MNFTFSPCGSFYAKYLDNVKGSKILIWNSHSTIVADVQLEVLIQNLIFYSNDRLALCMKDADVLIYSISHQKILVSLKGDKKSPMVDFVALDQGIGYSVSQSGTLYEWDLNTFQLLRKNDYKMFASKLALDSSKNLLAIAGHQIQLVNLTDFKVQKSFKGHSSNVSGLSFVQNENFLISFADQERSLSVWAYQEANESCHLLLSCDANLGSMSVSMNGDVSALDQAGQVFCWRTSLLQTPTKKKKSKHRSAQSSLVLRNIDDPSQKVPIYAASFSLDQLVVLYGNEVQPFFESVSYMDSDSNLLPSIELERSTKFSMECQSSTKAPLASNLSIVSGQDVNMPKVGLASDSLEEQLKKIEILNQDGNPKDIKINSAVSLFQILNQAIVSEDSDLLERCLQVRDVKMISATVSRLSSVTVIPLLQQIVERLQKNPNRGLLLIEWIRATLIYHSSYLLSVPDLSAQLSNLYRSLESRTSCFEKMVRLSGRLDLVICQSSLRHSKKDDDKQDQAQVTFVEEDEDYHLLQDDSLTETESETSLVFDE